MRRAALAIAALLGLAAGCGLGPGDERKAGVELRVTRDFGSERLASASAEKVREDQTVMRLLQDERDVKTSYGGRFVTSIDGLASSTGSRPADWFYYVNGVEASTGAGERELARGDVVQWDHRRWHGAMRVPAIVGAWPEPFRSGSEGTRFPVRVECEDDAGTACMTAKRRLRDAGVPASGARIGAGSPAEAMRVVVGRWPAIRSVRALRKIEEGAARSGVFARFEDDGRRLALLEEGGKAKRTATPGTGLVAATRLEDEQPVWAVTGVDAAGVDRAADALDERSLRDAFAVAATPAGVERLPLR